MSFAQWQPAYSRAGVACFPVTPDKTPAIRNYLKIGHPGSAQLVGRFGDAEAFGFALGRRSGLTILDIDTPDERVLADALARHGTTPIVVRSASGNWQAWYRHDGERRLIRPDPARPIDILGGGFVVAPPSRVTKGHYGFVQGGLEDLPILPKMQGMEAPQPATDPAHGASAHIPQGQRNDTLFRRCMAQAKHCDDLDALLDVAYSEAEAMHPPVTEAEIEKTAQSAWGYTQRGENWFGEGKRVPVHFDEVDDLMQSAPDAFMLLMYLRRHHGAHVRFHVANDMGERMPGGWTRKRMSAARGELKERGLIQKIHPASSFYGPAVYELT